MKIIETIKQEASFLCQKYEASNPEWKQTDSPLKYVSWAMDETIAKSLNLAMVLNVQPGSRVFEIGPGAGYLLYILQEAYGAVVYGCDVADRPLYKDMHKALGISGIADEKVMAYQIVPFFHKNYNLIVATQIACMDDWDQGAVDFFINNCMAFLSVTGRIVLFPNPKAFKGRPIDDVFKQYQLGRMKLPWLGEGVVIGLPL